MHREPERPQYMGSQRVRHNWVTNTYPKNKSQNVYHYLMGPGSFPASQPIMNHLDFSKNTVCCEVTLPFPLHCPLPGCPSPSQHSLHRSSLIYIYFSVSLKVTSTLKPSWPTVPTSPSAELMIPSLYHLHTLQSLTCWVPELPLCIHSLSPQLDCEPNQSSHHVLVIFNLHQAQS